MADELVAVADIVGLVVFGVREDHQHAVGGEVLHLAPEARTDEEAFTSSPRTYQPESMTRAAAFSSAA